MAPITLESASDMAAPVQAQPETCDDETPALSLYAKDEETCDDETLMAPITLYGKDETQQITDSRLCFQRGCKDIMASITLQSAQAQPETCDDVTHEMAALSLYGKDEETCDDETHEMAVLSLYGKDEETCDDETLMAPITLYGKDETQQNTDEARSRSRFQRGCRDLDSFICVLTPIFQVGRGMDGHLFIHFGDKTLCYTGTSPAKRLESNTMVAEFVAECTYRLEASEEIVQYGTAFAASPTAVVTAGHLLFPEGRSDYYTIINCIPAANSMFSNVKNVKGSLSKAQLATSDTLPRMTDPISGNLYSAYGDCMDAAILLLSQRAMHRGPLIKRFKKFLLPMSITDAISMYGKNGSIAIGVCGFPMVTEFMRKVRSSNKDDQTYTFQTYKLCAASCWKRLQEEKTSDGERKLLLLSKIVELLENTFEGLSTGSMTCSVGRVIGYNDTSIASSYTCLQGSSGSPLFSPDIPFPGVFLGIQDTPAKKKVISRGEIYPDYNVATSSDNLAFVKHHVSNVLPTLSPSAFTKDDKQRIKVFCLWLWRHFNFIMASKDEIMGGKEWSKEHASWFNIMLEELGGASTLFIELTDEEGKKLIRRCKEMRTELYAVYSQCKIHVSIEDFGAMLEGVETLLSVLMLIAPKVRETGLSLCAWGFPKPCTARSVHMLQKVALMLE